MWTCIFLLITMRIDFHKENEQLNQKWKINVIN